MTRFSRMWAGSMALLLWGAAGVCTGAQCKAEDEAAMMQIRRSAINATLKNGMGVPSAPVGTNLGGWLCLEDWFFSGSSGRYVSTTDPVGQGACLPPLMMGDNESWPSEGVLVQRLVKKYGKKFAAQVFEAHRNTFIGPSDLEAMVEMGIQVVRIPIIWTLFADALAGIDQEAYGSHDPHKDTVIVPDPFYKKTISYATIPRNLLEDLFIQGSRMKIKFLLDIHAFPGGSSDGTYNGLWPEKPVFWKETVTGPDTKEPVSLEKVGLMIVAAAVKWLEGLEGEAKEAVYGLSPMNEPAHLAGIEDQKTTFALPEEGVKMYMQVIETAFPGGSFFEVVPPWWKKTTTESERNTWAVFDMHWYTAWGTKAGDLSTDVAVLCSRPVDEILQVLGGGLRGFAESFEAHFDGQKATSEFSASTNADALVACSDTALTKAFMLEQVKVMEEHGIKPYFWSLKMPYGPIFEAGWSLKKLFNLEEKPRFPCAVGAGFNAPDGTVACFSANC